jgi:TRAP-type C4-dicarboxylate transport system permease small subunit
LGIENVLTKVVQYKEMGKNMKKPTGQKIISNMEKGTTFFSAVFILIMACLITADVICRYLINSPIRGSYEITENYLMVFIVYFGLVHAYREGAHIRLTSVVSHFPSRAKLGASYFVQTFSFIYVVFLFISATKANLLGKFTETLDITKNLAVPLWPSYAVISGGLLLMILLVFVDFWKVKKGESGLFKEES